MSEFAVRIGRVKLKGGADLHIMHNPMPDEMNGEAENWRGKLVEHARAISEHGNEDSRLDGYIVVGLFSDGGTSVAFRIPARVPSSLVPSYVADIMRRDTVTHEEAARTFDDKFEWRE